MDPETKPKMAEKPDPAIRVIPFMTVDNPADQIVVYIDEAKLKRLDVLDDQALAEQLLSKLMGGLERPILTIYNVTLVVYKKKLKQYGKKVK